MELIQWQSDVLLATVVIALYDVGALNLMETENHSYCCHRDISWPMSNLIISTVTKQNVRIDLCSFTQIGEAKHSLADWWAQRLLKNRPISEIFSCSKTSRPQVSQRIISTGDRMLEPVNKYVQFIDKELGFIHKGRGLYKLLFNLLAFMWPQVFCFASFKVLAVNPRKHLKLCNF